MKGYIGVTDKDWFTFLSQQPGIDEVNFWQPGGSRLFKSLLPGEPFLFKLHSPQNYIVGGGFFAHSTILPLSLAWSAFGIKNGAISYSKMRSLIERNRHSDPSLEDYKIGCILLTQPFFLQPHDWVSVPPDFSLNIVQGKVYDLTNGHGHGLWEQVKERLQAMVIGTQERVMVAEPQNRYGEPILILPRLGQGSFRVLVTDVYQRRCAITREKTLPALEAAHIKPFSEAGPHRVDNGLLLRSDVHRLFDAGYATVTTDQRFVVSKRIKEEFDNGEEYQAFHGRRIWVPPSPPFQPSPEFLSWHNEKVFRG
jgi:putative restriction endonuclease